MLRRALCLTALASLALAPSTLAATFGNGTNVSDDSAELIWRGETGNRSCSLTAEKEGTVSMTADNQYLTSAGNYGTPAELSYVTNGNNSDRFLIKSTDSVVLFGNGNDNQIAKGQFQHATVDLYFDGSNLPMQVWQNRNAVPLTNQRGHQISGSGNLDVDVRTNGHRNQNGEVQFGSYIVKTTVVCVVQ